MSRFFCTPKLKCFLSMCWDLQLQTVWDYWEWKYGVRVHYLTLWSRTFWIFNFKVKYFVKVFGLEDFRTFGNPVWTRDPVSSFSNTLSGQKGRPGMAESLGETQNYLLNNLLKFKVQTKFNFQCKIITRWPFILWQGRISHSNEVVSEVG